MNIPCSIIKDLLPLYHDNVCSEDTKRVVEEHLKTCPDCRGEYEKMLAADGIVSSAYDEERERMIAESYKHVKRRNTVKIIIASVLTLVLVCILAALTIFGIKLYKTWPVYPQPVKSVETVEKLRTELEKDGLELLIPDPELLHTKADYGAAISLTDRTRYAKAIGYWMNGHSSECGYYWHVRLNESPLSQTQAAGEYKGISIRMKESVDRNTNTESQTGRRHIVAYQFAYNGVRYTVSGSFDDPDMTEEEIVMKQQTLSEDLLNVVKQMIDSVK